MIKLFTGLQIPDQLSQTLNLLKVDVPGAHWETPQNSHITLSYIGEVDDAAAKRVEASLRNIQAARFQLTLNDIGTFSRGDDPNVLWMGVVKEDGLIKLKEKIDAALQADNLPSDKREYRPHMTLAFLNKPDKEKLGAFVQKHKNIINAFEVSEFILYQTTGTSDAPVYKNVAAYPLTPHS